MPDEQPTSIHKAAPSFSHHYRLLPEDIQTLADNNFELLEKNLRHPSLQLKKIGKIWSARVSRDYRALAVAVPNGFLWFCGYFFSYESTVRLMRTPWRSRSFKASHPKQKSHARLCHGHR